MTETVVVNLKRGEKFDVYIGRRGQGYDGYFGNPFSLEPGQPRGSTIEKYKGWFLTRLITDTEFRRRVLELRGKRLGCFCKPMQCHGDVIVAWLKENPS